MSGGSVLRGPRLKRQRLADPCEDRAQGIGIFTGGDQPLLQQRFLRGGQIRSVDHGLHLLQIKAIDGGQLLWRIGIGGDVGLNFCIGCSPRICAGP